ncbi:hypothetical protein HYU93_03190 [Candidatus Daviesbacteria bacterium]|nr:hypothetical protein [Candidatus Daviesbacteria bacterium]
MKKFLPLCFSLAGLLIVSTFLFPSSTYACTYPETCEDGVSVRTCTGSINDDGNCAYHPYVDTNCSACAAPAPAPTATTAPTANTRYTCGTHDNVPVLCNNSACTLGCTTQQDTGSDCRTDGCSGTPSCPSGYSGEVKCCRSGTCNGANAGWCYSDCWQPSDPPSCNNNGIWDNGEAGIDCGGGNCGTPCPRPSPPSGLTSSCPVPGTTADLSWNATANAARYQLRVDNTTAGGWIVEENCTPLGTGDICNNSKTGTAESFTSIPGNRYNWWLEACNSNGCSGSAGGPIFTCPNPPPAPVVFNSYSCIYPLDSGLNVYIRWTNNNLPVTYVDISTDSNFSSWYNKYITDSNSEVEVGVGADSVTFTDATGFFGASGVSGALTYNPDTTYYVRLYNGSYSPTRDFKVDTACVTLSGRAIDGATNAGLSGVDITPTEFRDVCYLDKQTTDADGYFFYDYIPVGKQFCLRASEGVAGYRGPNTRYECQTAGREERIQTPGACNVSQDMSADDGYDFTYCPIAQSCPTTCRTAATTVPDGFCGTTTCPTNCTTSCSGNTCTAPAAPTVSSLSCVSSTAYTASISWTDTDKITWVDISSGATDAVRNENYSHKDVSAVTTTKAPTNFNVYLPTPATTTPFGTFAPGTTTYYARVSNNSATNKNSTWTAFSKSSCPTSYSFSGTVYLHDTSHPYTGDFTGFAPVDPGGTFTFDNTTGSYTVTDVPLDPLHDDYQYTTYRFRVPSNFTVRDGGYYWGMGCDKQSDSTTPPCTNNVIYYNIFYGDDDPNKLSPANPSLSGVNIIIDPKWYSISGTMYVVAGDINTPYTGGYAVSSNDGGTASSGNNNGQYSVTELPLDLSDPTISYYQFGFDVPDGYRVTGSDLKSWSCGGSWGQGVSCPGPFLYGSVFQSTLQGTPETTGINIYLQPIPAPTITSSLSCISGSHSGNEISFSWTNPTLNIQARYMDISTDSSFATYYHKNITDTITTNGTGFEGFQDVLGTLTYTPDTTYYVRLWNGYNRSQSISFTTPSFCPLTASCSPMPNSIIYTRGSTTWTPFPAGGTGSYTYQWSFTGCSAEENCVSTTASTPYKIYYTAGTKEASVIVESGVQSITANCTLTVNNVTRPWIQVTGDVHSNTGIKAPGGP